MSGHRVVASGFVASKITSVFSIHQKKHEGFHQMQDKSFTESSQHKWDRRFLERAANIAQWSKDPSSKVGAVLVRPDRTTAGEGFNGFPIGLDDSPELYLNREYKIATVLHAEENCLLHSRDYDMRGYTLYVSGLPPCCSCASKIIQKGISRVVAHNRMVPARWAQNMRWAVENMLQKGITIELYAPGLGEWREVYRPDDLWIEGGTDASCDPSQVCGCAA